MGPIAKAAASLLRSNNSGSQYGGYAGTYIYSPPCHSDDNAVCSNSNYTSCNRGDYIYSNQHFTSYTPEQYHNNFIYKGK